MIFFICIKCFKVWDEFGNAITSDMLVELLVECDEVTFRKMFCIGCSN